MANDALTKTEFKEVMDTLFRVVATKDDVGDLRGELAELRQLVDAVQGDTGTSRKDHDELVVLRARYDRLAGALVKRGIVNKDDVRA